MMCLADVTTVGNEPQPRKGDGFTKWEPLEGFYVDPSDLTAAYFAQSAATVGGNVAPFQLTTEAKAHDPRD